MSRENYFDTKAIVNKRTISKIQQKCENDKLRCELAFVKSQRDILEKCLDIAIDIIVGIGGEDCCGCKYRNTEMCDICDDKDKLKEYFLDKIEKDN